jgi:hypothetical protein
MVSCRTMYLCIVRKEIPSALSPDTRAAASLVTPLDGSLACEESQRNGSAQHDSRGLSEPCLMSHCASNRQPSRWKSCVQWELRTKVLVSVICLKQCGVTF